MNRFVIPILKFFLVIGLLFILINKGVISINAIIPAIIQSRDLATGCLLSLLAVVLGSLRFHLLLRFQAIRLTFLRTLRLTLIGGFYNLGLPGSVTGDFVKGAYLAREAPDKKSGAFAAILVDRISGLLALIFISSGALTLDRLLSLNRSVLFLQLSIYGLLSGSFIFIFCLFGLNEKSDLLFRMLLHLSQRFSHLKGALAIYRNLKSYRRQPKPALISLLVSFGIHLAVCAANIFFLRALGVKFSASGDVFVILPLAILSLSFPLFPLGLGTGHLSFWYLFHLIGLDQGANLYNLRLLCAIGVGILGGFMALKFPTNFGREAKQLNIMTHSVKNRLSDLI